MQLRLRRVALVASLSLLCMLPSIAVAQHVSARVIAGDASDQELLKKAVLQAARSHIAGMVDGDVASDIARRADRLVRHYSRVQVDGRVFFDATFDRQLLTETLKKHELAHWRNDDPLQVVLVLVGHPMAVSGTLQQVRSLMQERLQQWGVDAVVQALDQTEITALFSHATGAVSRSYVDPARYGADILVTVRGEWVDASRSRLMITAALPSAGVSISRRIVSPADVRTLSDSLGSLLVDRYGITTADRSFVLVEVAGIKSSAQLAQLIDKLLVSPVVEHLAVIAIDEELLDLRLEVRAEFPVIRGELDSLSELRVIREFDDDFYAADIVPIVRAEYVDASQPAVSSPADAQ